MSDDARAERKPRRPKETPADEKNAGKDKIRSEQLRYENADKIYE